MENNCLVTKLKGSVTGDAPIFGNLEVVFAGTDTPKFQIFSVLNGEESTISGDNGIIFKNSSLTAELSNPFTINKYIEGFHVICTTDAKMVVTNKYKLRAVATPSEEWEYSLKDVKEFIGGIDSYIHSIPGNTTKLTLIKYHSKIELSDFIQKIGIYKDSVNIFDFQQSKLIEGNINAFCNINNLKNISVSYCPLINGNIADLKSITTLENIACVSTQVGGTIEEFVAGQRAAGRTTGSVSGNSGGWGMVTFDGATTHAKGIVNWTDNTITMDGVTINK